MYSARDLHNGRGFPIRTSADQRSLASPRGFSQRATSFIASWRQGIHRTPLSHSPSNPKRPHAVPNRAKLPGADSKLTLTQHTHTSQIYLSMNGSGGDPVS